MKVLILSDRCKSRKTINCYIERGRQLHCFYFFCADTLGSNCGFVLKLIVFFVLYGTVIGSFLFPCVTCFDSFIELIFKVVN